jgi:arginyl-tRNA synthetase
VEGVQFSNIYISFDSFLLEMIKNICLFQLAQTFNSFYAALSINNAESEEKKQLRLRTASWVATIIASGMSLLGISVPEKM